jgi:hypothetical protein
MNVPGSLVRLWKKSKRQVRMPVTTERVAPHPANPNQPFKEFVQGIERLVFQRNPSDWRRLRRLLMTFSKMVRHSAA